jgi:hypothetical protein
MNFLIVWAGYLLIWIAMDVGRKENSKVEIFSWNFLLQVILVSIGTGIISAMNQTPCE